MKKPKIKVAITKERTGYSANTLVNKYFISTEAETFSDLKKNLIKAINLTFEEEKISYTIDEIQFRYDLESFFDFYKIINVKALSERIGMNQSLLAQYIKGIKTPSTTQTKRILDGVHQIGRELCDIQFLMD